MVRILQRPDADVEIVAAALREYEAANAGSECFVYRYNPAAIRVKIVDEAFRGRRKSDRHDDAWRFLSRLPEDALSQISVLLCLAPGESSLLDAEFADPSPSFL